MGMYGDELLGCSMNFLRAIEAGSLSGIHRFLCGIYIYTYIIWVWGLGFIYIYIYLGYSGIMENKMETTIVY